MELCKISIDFNKISQLKKDLSKKKIEKIIFNIKLSTNNSEVKVKLFLTENNVGESGLKWDS